MENRREEVQVLPKKNEVFEAFYRCPYEKLQVIIIGQEPYPDANHAHGLAFSSLSKTTPYSLKVIFNEIWNTEFWGMNSNCKMSRNEIFRTNNLTCWAKQGILLLNCNLTVDKGQPNSHTGMGWNTFIKNTIKFLNSYEITDTIHHNNKPIKSLVYLLMGNNAKRLKECIDIKRHYVLEVDHPASTKYNKQKWNASRCFTVINEFIHKNHRNIRPQINWMTY